MFNTTGGSSLLQEPHSVSRRRIFKQRVDLCHLCLNINCFLVMQHGNVLYIAGINGPQFISCRKLAVEINRVYLGLG